MFYLECQCKFRHVWNEIDNVGPFQNLDQATWAARQQVLNRRTAVRVTDDQGNVWFEAAFPYR
jgi:hypothetical protein